MKNSLQFIQFFRQAAPYIHQHRGKTFVFCIQDDEATKSILKSLLHDIAILHSLGVRVAIVFGARQTINATLTEQQFHGHHRITNASDMIVIQEIIGSLGIQVQSILSMGLANSPMQGASIQTVSGNFITAKPIGVRDGIDHGLTGEIRKVRVDSIDAHLQNGHIAVIPPLGYSSTGEVFNLTTESVAGAVASALGADKLIFFSDETRRVPGTQKEGAALSVSQAVALADSYEDIDILGTMMRVATDACQQSVNRVHIIPKATDGAILAELFSRDGVGLMITNEAYDRIEQANANDIPSLLQLIRPLEQQGILVRRSRELLEMEIESFSLMKRDNSVIGCAALYSYADEGMAELGCVAVSPEYQKHGLAEKLLEHIEKQVRDQDIKKLFCLTTHTSHWFVERGFVPVELSDLPTKKQQFYNSSRSSRPYMKILS